MAVFGHELYRDVYERLGLPFFRRIEAGSECEGYVDAVSVIKGDAQYLRVHGWIFDGNQKKIPRYFWILSSDAVAIGYGLTGAYRPDVASIIDPAAVESGFKGYVYANMEGMPVTLFDPETMCKLSTKLPVAS